MMPLNNLNILFKELLSIIDRVGWWETFGPFAYLTRFLDDCCYPLFLYCQKLNMHDAWQLYNTSCYWKQVFLHLGDKFEGVFFFFFFFFFQGATWKYKGMKYEISNSIVWLKSIVASYRLIPFFPFLSYTSIILVLTLVFLGLLFF